MRWWTLSLALFIATDALAAETATIAYSTALRSAPASDAVAVTTLEADTRVEAGERRGGWVAVKLPADRGASTGRSGWVRLLALRYGEGRRGSSGAFQLFNVARSGSSGTVVTTGVRGLDDELIAKASPNRAELAKLEGFAENADGARRFAENIPLRPQRIDYPPEPKP